MGLHQETQLFDYIGTSAWSIQMLLEKGFQRFFHFPAYSYMRVLEKGDQYMIVHRDYYLRFKHDFLQSYQRETYHLGEKDYHQFQKKYQRRIPRFFETIRDPSSSKILFLRLEEYNPDRVYYQEYKREESEVEQMLALCQSFKTLFPEKNITTLFLTSQVQESQWYQDENLYLLSMPEPILEYDDCETKIHETLLEHMVFL